MRKFLFAVVTLSLLTTFLISCNDDDEEPSSVLSAKINGILFEATELEGTYYENGDIYVSGEKSDGSAFEISLELNEVSTGTYTLPSDDGAIYIYYYDANGDSYEPDQGSIIISKISEESLEATFSFVYENLAVTEGVVRVKLEKD